MNDSLDWMSYSRDSMSHSPRAGRGTHIVPGRLHPPNTKVDRIIYCLLLAQGLVMTVRETPGGLLGLGIFALVFTTVGNGVWGGLLATNLRTSPRLPWSVPVMAGVLWVAWSYLSGDRGDSSKSALRRRRLRARAVSPRTWEWAAVAGTISIVSLAGLWIVLEQLMPMKGNVLPEFSRYPPLVVVLIIVMASFTGAALEEAAFRGYFQSALESRLGGPVAILVTALMMLPAHGLTQGFGVATIVFYLCVDAMLGLLAYLVQSIVPGVIVHAVGLVVFFSLIWPFDEGRRIIGSEGPDAWFWIHVIQALVGIMLSVLAFRRLARVTTPLRALT
jgi:membrane protease YdiL (CAAX protease family)